ncbi:MAG: serine hydrolase, partial [bacterium]|nr:serine hydrolase [bacterium]
MRIRILSTRAGVSAALAGILVFALTSCTSPDPHAVEIDRLARSLHDAGEFDGVILVAEAGKVIYREAFGTSDCESGEEHSPNTIFDLASITKPFTATAVLMLVEEG